MANKIEVSQLMHHKMMASQATQNDINFLKSFAKIQMFNKRNNKHGKKLKKRAKQQHHLWRTMRVYRS